jgi:Rha family phage regulatory protein
MSREITGTTPATDKPAPLADSALVHLEMGRPVTDSLAIADEFGRRHDNVLQSLDALISDGTISRLDSKERDYTDKRGKKQRMIELTERGALIAMPFIGGRNARAGQVRLVNAFLTLRDKLAENIGDWTELRKKVSVGYQMMCSTLQEVRAEQDKTTSPFHYANEARLINWVLFGRFEAVKRDSLAQTDLAMMDSVEAQNAIWIARGRCYDQRKAALPAYLLSLRTKRLRGA